MPVPLVSVIVLNWNGESLISECLDSLTRLEYSPVEILFIDNASTDRSVEIATRYRDVVVIKNSTNLGYAAGNNVGFQRARGKYVATINNDMVVDPAWLNQPVQIMEKSPSVGIVSCRQMRNPERGIIDGLYAVLRSDLGCSPMGDELPLAQFPQHARSGLVFAANGGSAIYRREVIGQLGGFDEYFFGYYEEVDLCMRALARGWKCYYEPAAVVYHRNGSSFGRVSEKYFYLRERNRFLFIYRNFPLALIMSRLPHLCLYELRCLFVLAFRRGLARTFFRSRLDALGKMPSYRSLRRENLHQIRNQTGYLRQLIRSGIIPVGPIG